MCNKVLLTSVCRPLGPKYGDAPSVGYELLHRQVTRAQGVFSPRTVNVQFSLDYIAENLDAPTVVLQYPSKQELIRELKRGYAYVGICFVMALLHKMKEVVALIRLQAPQSQIVLGGYGTVLNDEVLRPYADVLFHEPEKPKITKATEPARMKSLSDPVPSVRVHWVRKDPVGCIGVGPVKGGRNWRD